MKLNELQIGSTATILSVGGEGALRQHFLDMGLIQGTEVTVAKLFDQNLALTNGAPSKMSELLALNIFNTFYGRAGYEGVGQAKAVIFFLIVGLVAVIQNRMTRSKEVQQ